MLGMRDIIAAMKKMLVIEERVGQLAEQIAGDARAVNEELGEIRREQRELRDRVSRIEGAFSVLRQLQGPVR
jgi:putative component of toxin-antitoxin plasmid stabilization module